MFQCKGYYKIFGLKPRFDIDKGYLKRRFIALQEMYHPDLYVTKPIVLQFQLD
jgi:DnaJ-class molecular chaperone